MISDMHGRKNTQTLTMVEYDCAYHRVAQLADGGSAGKENVGLSIGGCQRGIERKNLLPAPSVLSIHMRPP